MALKYKGVLGYPVVITATPSAGGTTVTFGSVLTTDMPQRERDIELVTPASGDDAGDEMGLIGQAKACDVSLDCLYSKADLVLIDALDGVDLDLSMTIPAESSATLVYTGTGAMKKSGVSKLDPTKRMRAAHTLHWDAGWTMA